jgi:hypothetical protein
LAKYHAANSPCWQDSGECWRDAGAIWGAIAFTLMQDIDTSEGPGMRISPELGGVSVVMIGHFNPSIFSPLWFQKLGLATENEVNKAEIAVILPEVAIFKLGTKDIHVQLGQFMAQSSEAPWINLADFMVRTFGEFLPHTPISQIGINRSVHFSVGSEDVRNRIGRMLAPTKPWGEWGEEIERSSTNLRGGVITLIMHEPWVEGEFSGRYEARVEPSRMIGGNLGIFVNVNRHCELVNPGTSVAADKIIGFLQSNFEDSKNGVSGSLTK